MEQKAENPIQTLEGTDVTPLIAAYFELCHLKQLYRQGWLRRGVPRQRCESVAEHTFGAAMLALWLAQTYRQDLDLCKVVQLALVHDFGEVYAGDIIPADGISEQEKSQHEAESVRQVFSKLMGGQTWIELWQEFEEGMTNEARFVRQIDRLEMGLQAVVYARQGSGDMSEFIESARRALTDGEIISLLGEAADLTMGFDDKIGRS
ncbi:MAG: HD domain-containing protein [Anaerolineales bacterium]|jgi:putative hydrolase of HD superfamily|nr:HD domain-containing protein [Anaerolineales bacterium]